MLPLLLLDTQYRMHPFIAEWPSAAFYGGKLKSGITAADRPIPQVFPANLSGFVTLEALSVKAIVWPLVLFIGCMYCTLTPATKAKYVGASGKYSQAAPIGYRASSART